MGRLLKVAFLAGIVALVTMAVPDIKRYLKMSSM
jgi:hypothetical protein